MTSRSSRFFLVTSLLFLFFGTLVQSFAWWTPVAAASEKRHAMDWESPSPSPSSSPLPSLLPTPAMASMQADALAGIPVTPAPARFRYAYAEADLGRWIRVGWEDHRVVGNSTAFQKTRLIRDSCPAAWGERAAWEKQYKDSCTNYYRSVDRTRADVRPKAGSVFSDHEFTQTTNGMYLLCLQPVGTNGRFGEERCDRRLFVNTPTPSPKPTPKPLPTPEAGFVGTMAETFMRFCDEPEKATIICRTSAPKKPIVDVSASYDALCRAMQENAQLNVANSINQAQYVCTKTDVSLTQVPAYFTGQMSRALMEQLGGVVNLVDLGAYSLQSGTLIGDVKESVKAIPESLYQAAMHAKETFVQDSWNGNFATSTRWWAITTSNVFAAVVGPKTLKNGVSNALKNTDAHQQLVQKSAQFANEITDGTRIIDVAAVQSAFRDTLRRQAPTMTRDEWLGHIDYINTSPPNVSKFSLYQAMYETIGMSKLHALVSQEIKAMQPTYLKAKQTSNGDLFTAFYQKAHAMVAFAEKAPLPSQREALLRSITAELQGDQMVSRSTLYLGANGRVDWPRLAPDNGFLAGSKTDVTLAKGSIVDRYGSAQGGFFVADAGASWESRALPYLKNTKAYHKYRVVKDIPLVQKGQAAPVFQQIGGATQYELPAGLDVNPTISSDIDWLLKNGYLEELH